MIRSEVPNVDGVRVKVSPDILAKLKVEAARVLSNPSQIE